MVYIEKRLVESATDGIADLVPDISIEMILVDDKGAKIHATIRKQLIHMFESKLEEGHVYEMSIFSVFSQSGNYRTTLHPYKLVFHLRTKVTVVESPDISQFGMHFTSLAEIGAFTQDG
ncbi:replication factor-A carboxy-terminal domain protein, partial [Trifolium pratense]